MHAQTSLCTPGRIWGSPLDPVVAVTFLEQQACGLRHGLAAPHDPAVIAEVLAAQDLAHEAWLSLTSALASNGHAQAAEEVAAVYGFHGRVAAQLERGLDPRLDDGVAARVRTVLLAELQSRTAAACETLLGALGQPQQSSTPSPV